MVNYGNGKVYKIQSHLGDKIYVGSTSNNIYVNDLILTEAVIKTGNSDGLETQKGLAASGVVASIRDKTLVFNSKNDFDSVRTYMREVDAELMKYQDDPSLAEEQEALVKVIKVVANSSVTCNLWLIKNMRSTAGELK